MNRKQFELFQTAIQWVVDEHREPTHSPSHLQSTWAVGRVLFDKVTAYRRKDRPKTFQVVCPTACCVAGDICLTNGDTFVVGCDEEPVRYNTAIAVDYVVDEDGKLHEIGARARSLVGITGPEANELFEGGNRVEDITRVATSIAARRDFDLDLK